MKKSDFYYELPSELIAQAPLSQRTQSRLLCVPPSPAPFENRVIADLPALLKPNDLLIFNNTKVIPARLFGKKTTGGQVEILLERLLPNNQALAQIGASKSPKIGSRIELSAGGSTTVLGREGEFYHLQFDVENELADWLQHTGQLPLPPYIQRSPDIADQHRYQTVFAKTIGAVAAPTAGLHFDQELLSSLQKQHINLGYVTLHVGAGTFQPVRVENLSEHIMHRERAEVSSELIQQIQTTRQHGGRVIAVGTTVVRALESALAHHQGELKPFVGDTQLFIVPGYRINSIDALITNFHLPESTLLMMVSAFAGQSRVFEAYSYAISQQYRFFSYGDAMLLFPDTSLVK